MTFPFRLAISKIIKNVDKKMKEKHYQQFRSGNLLRYRKYGKQDQKIKEGVSGVEVGGNLCEVDAIKYITQSTQKEKA